MLDLDLQRFDGISMRVKGDGQTYKFNLKTADQMNVAESTYQAQYDTVDGEWTTVYMPWHQFVPVTRAQYDAKAKPLDPAQVKQMGLVLSRFHYNSLPNQRHKPGKFELQVGCYQCLCCLLVDVSGWDVQGGHLSSPAPSPLLLVAQYMMICMRELSGRVLDTHMKMYLVSTACCRRPSCMLFYSSFDGSCQAQQ